MLLTLSPKQQSCSRQHLEKNLNIHSAERNKHFLSCKAFKTLWQRKKLLLLQEQFLPLSQCFQMSSAAAADIKTSIYGVKGLTFNRLVRTIDRASDL